MATESWSGNHGILCVYISKAKDLPNLNKLDKQNVMLRLRIAHMTRESDVLLRAGQNPVFNYMEKYEITPEVRPIMQVEAYCDRRKKPPILIGRVEVDLLNGIRADPKEGYCSWYELKRERNEFAGTIFIELTFTPRLPRSQREKHNGMTENIDASIACRAVPNLPGDSHNLDSGTNNSASASYMHASAVRDFTPRVEDQREFTPVISHSLPPLSDYTTNFNSSVSTNRTSNTQDTEVTTSSDTRFHFANLKKLKERINVFKNANSSLNNNGNQSDTPVDIEALQKAIGVTSLDNEEGERDTLHENRNDGDRRTSRLNSSPRLPQLPEPPLPPLPTNTRGTPSQGSYMNGMSWSSGHRYEAAKSPFELRGTSSPQLPPLPVSPHTRERSLSPRRRPPPASR